jgi:hypothetical protein
MKYFIALLLWAVVAAPVFAEAPIADRACTLTGFATYDHAVAHLHCPDRSIAPVSVGLSPNTGGRGLLFLSAEIVVLSLFVGSSGYFCAMPLLVAFLAPGVINDESDWFSYAQHSLSSSKFEMKISKEKAGEILDYIKTMRAQCESSFNLKCYYQMVGYNCIDFVQDLFRLAGESEHFVNRLDGPVPTSWKLYAALFHRFRGVSIFNLVSLF